MIIKPWIYTRIALNSILAALSVFIVVKTIIFPVEQKKIADSSEEIPSKILLSKAQFVKSKPLLGELPRYKNGYEYQYREYSQQEIITVQLRHESDSDGNVSRLVSLYQSIQPATIQWQVISNSQGNYAIFNYQQKLHFTACLNKQGNTSVTERDFAINSYPSLGDLQRLFSWLMGIKNFTDSQCWWILLTVDLSPNITTNQELINFVKNIDVIWQEWINKFSTYTNS
jgi:cyanosortase A-associated protein